MGIKTSTLEVLRYVFVALMWLIIIVGFIG